MKKVRASETQSAKAGGKSGDAGVIARVVEDTGDAVGSETDRSRSDGQRREEEKGDRPEWDSLAEEDEALELISGSVRRQVEAEVFVPVMRRYSDRIIAWRLKHSERNASRCLRVYMPGYVVVVLLPLVPWMGC